MDIRRYARILNGFLHDFASGCWLATVFAVYWLDRSDRYPQLAPMISELKQQFFYGGILCTVIVFATGAGRTFSYIDNYYGKDSEQVRRKMLIIKHIVLLAVFGFGTYVQYRMAFR